jgi:hypothetical protein
MSASGSKPPIEWNDQLRNRLVLSCLVAIPYAPSVSDEAFYTLIVEMLQRQDEFKQFEFTWETLEKHVTKMCKSSDIVVAEAYNNLVTMKVARALQLVLAGSPENDGVPKMLLRLDGNFNRVPNPQPGYFVPMDTDVPLSNLADNPGSPPYMLPHPNSGPAVRDRVWSCD